MQRSDLPQGTVTFFFSDIEGSTRLLGELGADEYADALTEHRAVIRSTFGRHEGVEVDTQGDAFFAAFATADAAVLAAAEIQDELADGAVKVRIGIHRGRPHIGAEGYVGPDVNLGARIAAAAHGGQIVLSAATREGLTDSLFDLTDLGEHRLKDFATSVALYQVGSETFPPLRTISNTNLPRPASPFLGRHREVAEVSEMIRNGARLLTLTGPGGTGKTRLALESAAEVIADFKAGVFWIGLAPIRDPALVVDTIAAVIGAKQDLATFIGEREMLLVVDNIEQVIDSAPELATLLEGCPALRLLVTSRERLRVRGEREYSVPPLTDDDAVALFVERAQVGPDEAVRDLCRQLDNLPLAIELAAARVNVLTPAQILDRLSKRLDLFSGGRDADARQRTLRSTVAWSYDLLAQSEQTAFAALAIFRGGWTEDAAEAIAGTDLTHLASLADKSLIRRREERFAMLETIREFASEKFAMLDDAISIRQKHADYFVRLAEEAFPHINGRDAKPWLDRLDADIDNIRAALDDMEQRNDLHGALRLAGALGPFWATRNVGEGARLLERLLAVSDPAPSQARLGALFAVSALVGNSGDFSRGREYMEQSVEMADVLGDRLTAARSRMNLGAIAADAGDWASAQQMYSDSMTELDELGDTFFALWARRMLAWMSYELGNVEGAKSLYREVLRRAREIDDERMQASALGALGEYAIRDNHLAEGLADLRRSIELFRGLGDRWYVAADMMRLGHALGVIGQLSLAAQILGAADAECERIGAMSWVEIIEFARTVAFIRGALDDVSWTREFAAGRDLAAEAAISRAFEVLEATVQS